MSRVGNFSYPPNSTFSTMEFTLKRTMNSSTPDWNVFKHGTEINGGRMRRVNELMTDKRAWFYETRRSISNAPSIMTQHK